MVILGRFADFLAHSWKRDNYVPIIIADQGPKRQARQDVNPYMSYALQRSSDFLGSIAFATFQSTVWLSLL